MRIFRKPEPPVKEAEARVKESEAANEQGEARGRGESQAEGITVFKEERKRKGSVPAKGKDRNASAYR